MYIKSKVFKYQTKHRMQHTFLMLYLCSILVIYLLFNLNTSKPKLLKNKNFKYFYLFIFIYLFFALTELFLANKIFG